MTCLLREDEYMGKIGSFGFFDVFFPSFTVIFGRKSG